MGKKNDGFAGAGVMNGATVSPFSYPLYVTIKPVGAVCNMRCSYCYYLKKKDLYPQEKCFVLNDELLERFTEQYLNSQTMNEVLFAWHGGEPLLRGIDFYRKALRLQKIYGGGRHIDNCIQTNGTLLTDEWCHFFHENRFLVGISIDGTQHLHDHYRKMQGNKPSFAQVIHGIELLKKHQVDFNIMGVVNDYNADYPLEFYHFFKQTDARFIQFSPIVELIDGHPAPYNVSAEKWGDFLIAIFDEWVRNDVGKFFIQYFDAVLANWMGMAPGVCSLAKNCGHAGIMEFNGDVYSCDHFVSPEYKLGNIYTETLTEMMYSKQQFQFGSHKSENLPAQCKACKYLFTCYGECPKNRILTTSTGEPGLNYLCRGYYKFFEHIAAYMEFMKNELLNRRSPANVMFATPATSFFRIPH